MSPDKLLESGANIAEIVTAIVAALAFGSYRFGIWRRRKRVEDYLWSTVTKPRWATDPVERTVDQLVTELWMSEQDILSAAFSSRNISRRLEGGSGPIGGRLRLSHVDKHAANLPNSN